MLTTTPDLEHLLPAGVFASNRRFATWTRSGGGRLLQEILRQGVPSVLRWSAGTDVPDFLTAGLRGR
jgi:hypothetical protein